MKNVSARALIALLGTLVAGCETLPVVQPSPVQVEQSEAIRESPDELESILEYLAYLRRLPEGDLAREHDRSRQAFATSASEGNRVRLALVLSLPAAPFKDQRHALKLLDPMVKDRSAQYTPLREFAFVVHALVLEQITLGSHAQTLKEKLDALKLLEKSLTERDRVVPGGRR
jgi:hypothetical protein